MLLIETPKLLAEVLPEVGGKIGQIRYKPLGCDVLVPPQKPYRTIPLQGDWLTYDTSGMDDCFPNIAAGDYPGEANKPVRLPDLGEWTHGSWEVVQADNCTATMRRRGHSLPYMAYKTVRAADDDTLEFSYRVENHGTLPIRYMWSAHPLIAVPGDYRLVVPGEDITFCTFPAEGTAYKWPVWKTVDLACDWIAASTDLKIFLTGLGDGWCALHLPEYTVRLMFSLSTTPVLGIWFNNYGFPSGTRKSFRCIALEPCTSPSDLLEDLDAAAYPSISPRGTAAWSFRLQIVPGVEPLQPANASR